MLPLQSHRGFRCLWSARWDGAPPPSVRYHWMRRYKYLHTLVLVLKLRLGPSVSPLHLSANPAASLARGQPTWSSLLHRVMHSAAFVLSQRIHVIQNKWVSAKWMMNPTVGGCIIWRGRPEIFNLVPQVFHIRWSFTLSHLNAFPEHSFFSPSHVLIVSQIFHNINNCCGLR